MEINTKDPNSKPVPADEPELDLYTIPAYSSWFSWASIHDTEMNYLGEFFDGTSISRTPKIYKEYRDFLISKYREEPSRRLTFTEVRKTLVGDVSLLHKVFLFLEKWGLINFSAPSNGQFAGVIESGGGESGYKVRVEEGPPHGVRVVANPNTLKPLSVPQILGNHGEHGFKYSPLASYSDVYGDLRDQKGAKCANCQEPCDSGHSDYTKERSTLCMKCFKSGNYGENKSADDFKFTDCTESNSTAPTTWTEAENLLLLDSVLKHGDDWDLVTQNVKTKSKLECISKLLEMPFGDLMLGSYHGKTTPGEFNGTMNSTKQVQFDSSESRETINPEEQCNAQVDTKQNNDAETENQGPKKKKCIASVSEADNSLMKKVAHISAKFPPNITAAAAQASIMALCEENPCIDGLFDGDKNNVPNGLGSSPPNNDPERAAGSEEGSDITEKLPLSGTPEMLEKNAMPLTLQIRATVATALGAAAAHAKSLADEEVVQMEQLVATVIETQLKKVDCKLKYFEDLEKMMGQECARIEELKESIIAERIDILQKACDAGISRWRHYVVKS